MTVGFLDSGQGDCTLLVSPKGRIMLIDCGSIKNRNVVVPGIVAVLQRFLPAQQNVIDTLVLTHPDEDHYNLLSHVLTATGATVRNVLFGGEAELYRNVKDNDWVYTFLTKVSKAAPLPNSVYGGATPTNFDGPLIHMLAANATGRREAADSLRRNTNSIVLLVTYGDYKIFLMGDATADTEAFILASVINRGPAQLIANERTSTLKMGHHGSDTSSSQAWVGALRPNELVISADTRTFGAGGAGMPKASQLDSVVGWSGKLTANFPSHGVVQFDDRATPQGFEVRTETRAVCSTLHAITYNADRSGFEAEGMSWFWRVGSDGSADYWNTNY
jgi:hypothetical protein